MTDRTTETTRPKVRGLPPLPFAEGHEPGFRNNANLFPAGTQLAWTQEHVAEYERCVADPEYFVETYVKIVHVDDGLVNFNLYPYQREILRTSCSNRYTLCRLSRQSGKTTVVVGIILWHLLFNRRYAVAIVANKMMQARDEIMARLRLAYEWLPNWLQQGIVTWNKSFVELENGSKVRAAATSSGSLRGSTWSMLYMDEFCHIHRNQQEDFFTSVVPTISSGKNTKIIITSTPKGLDYFYKLWSDSEKGKNEYKRIVINWNDPPGRDEAWRAARLGEMSQEQFDQEYGCEFLGSSGTLINGRVLARLPVDYPVQTTSWGVNVYDHPEAGRSYALVCDVSRGVALDYSAFAVFDVTELPYRVVATYRSNTVPNLSLADTLVDVARHFNEAVVLVESCDVGQAVVEHALYEHGYENTLTTNVGSKKGTVLGHGFGASSRLGVKTNKQVKRMGCFALKTLVENDKLLLRDATVISELSTFVAKGASWEAEPGCNDDLAMCCVLFGWLSVQPAFKEERNHDLRAAIARHAASMGEYDFTEFVGTVVDGSGEASGPRIVNGVTQTPPEYGDHEDYYASRDWGGMGVNDLTRSFRK